MRAFVSYDPETGEIKEWGQTSQPENLELQGATRGLVSILGAWSTETHYINISTEKAIERPRMPGIVEKDEQGIVHIHDAPSGAFVEVALAIAGQCDEEGRFISDEPVDTDHIVLVKWPYRNKTYSET